MTIRLWQLLRALAFPHFVTLSFYYIMKILVSMAFSLLSLSPFAQTQQLCPVLNGTYRYEEPKYDLSVTRTFLDQKGCEEIKMTEAIHSGHSELFTHTKTIHMDSAYYNWFAGQDFMFKVENGVLRQVIQHNDSQYPEMLRQEIDWFEQEGTLSLWVRSYYKNGKKLSSNRFGPSNRASRSPQVPLRRLWYFFCS